MSSQSDAESLDELAQETAAPEEDLRKKENLTKKNLEKYGIFFQQNAYEVSDLPEHADYLKSALLDFGWTISHRLGLSDDVIDIRDFKIDEKFDRLHIGDTERLSVRSSMTRYKKLQDDAESLIKEGAAETEWQDFFKKYFFEPLASSLMPSESDTRREAREKFYYLSFKHTGNNQLWLLFNDRPTLKGRVQLKLPKPDYVAFFTVFNHDGPLASETRKTRNAPGPAPRTPYGRWPFESQPRSGVVKNFSSQTLEHLARYGLESCVANLFRRKSAKPKRYRCFPWLIVEHKPTPSTDGSFCYCQAANAAHAVLTMLRNLAKFSDKGLPDYPHIPPVTTITTIGPEVKVWVAYVMGPSGTCKMCCVWEGDVRIPSDIIKLEAILENLHTYAMHELRPWISSYIDQWLDRFPRTAKDSPDKHPEPFADIENTSDIPSQPNSAAIPETPKASDPQIAESDSRTSSDISAMLQTQYRQLFDDLVQVIKEVQSPPAKTTSQFKFVSSPSSPSPEVDGSNSDLNKRIGSTSTFHSGASISPAIAPQKRKPFSSSTSSVPNSEDSAFDPGNVFRGLDKVPTKFGKQFTNSHHSTYSFGGGATGFGQSLAASQDSAAGLGVPNSGSKSPPAVLPLGQPRTNTPFIFRSNQDDVSKDLPNHSLLETPTPRNRSAGMRSNAIPIIPGAYPSRQDEDEQTQSSDDDSIGVVRDLRPSTTHERRGRHRAKSSENLFSNTTNGRSQAGSGRYETSKMYKRAVSQASLHDSARHSGQPKGLSKDANALREPKQSKRDKDKDLEKIAHFGSNSFGTDLFGTNSSGANSFGANSAWGFGASTGSASK